MTKGIYHPQDTKQLQALIRYARAHDLKVRVIGAKHSPQEAQYDADNKKQIIISLNEGEFRTVKSIVPDEKSENATATVTVGAGCYLGVNPGDKSSTWENSLNLLLWKAGYALPTLGGISHQSVAGFLQTSSSGGSMQHGIADAVESIKGVNGKGEIFEYKRGTDDFNATVVAMGLRGVITEVTFKVGKQYLVKGQEVNREIGKGSLLDKDKDGHRSALLKALREQEYMHLNCLPQEGVNRTMEWTGKRVAMDTAIKEYNHALRSKLMAFLARIVMRLGNLADILGPNNPLFKKLKAELLKLFSDPKEKQEFCDVPYKALPIDDQVHDGDGKLDLKFSEVWFPLPEDPVEARKIVDLVMDTLDQLYKDNPLAAGNFISEIYGAKKSPYWMSPSNGGNALRIDLYWWSRNFGDAKKYFGIFWDKLLQIPGACLHPGKYMPVPGEKYGDHTFTQEQLYKNYPKLDDWKKLREANDPQQLFVTDYWRKVLNIPQPEKDYVLVEAADVKPTEETLEGIPVVPYAKPVDASVVKAAVPVSEEKAEITVTEALSEINDALNILAEQCEESALDEEATQSMKKRFIDGIPKVKAVGFDMLIEASRLKLQQQKEAVTAPAAVKAPAPEPSYFTQALGYIGSLWSSAPAPAKPAIVDATETPRNGL